MNRPRHPDKDLEGVLKSAEDRGWIISKRPRGYYKMKCPCPDKHLKSVALTPSGAKYLMNLKHYLARLPCWKERQ